MRVIGVDIETYYDDKYRMGKGYLTTEEYVRDPRFEIIGVSVKLGRRRAPLWFSGTHAEILAFLDKCINWAEDAVLCHNTAFDGAIMSWILNRFPKLWIDTLSMARPRHLKTIGVALATLAKHYRLGEKGTSVLDAKGKRRADFKPQELADYGRYCCNDIELTYGLFKEFAKTTSALEMQVIDLTIRMFTEPKFRLNQGVLEQYLSEVIDEKQKLIAAVGEQSRDNFMSADSFAKLLQDEGVEPPTKWSDKQKKKVYAFAKTDKAMKELLEHESPRVQALTACRLGVKTTIEETRTASLLRIAKRGLFPIMLNYWGAGTGRFSGGGGVNPQNFRRGGKIKASLEVAAGYCVIDSDLSQIEARVLALVAGQDDLVNDFLNNVDIYCGFATDVFGRPITKADPDERFLGKTCVLGLGYYTGAAKLRETLRQGPGKDGKGGLTVSIEEAQRIVKLYRQKYSKIPQFWRACGRALDHMILGGSGYISQEFDIRYEGHKVYLPNGAVLDYPGLQQHRSEETGDLEMRYLNRNRWTKIYSGLLCENIIQALARGVICEYLVTIGAKYGVALQVHDSIVSVVPQSIEAEAKAFIENIMSIAVSWLPGLPVACEVKSGPSYGTAK